MPTIQGVSFWRKEVKSSNSFKNIQFSIVLFNIIQSMPVKSTLYQKIKTDEYGKFLEFSKILKNNVRFSLVLSYI
ncbi:hypothetical protein, partial [uncultured Dubosiella sp.]|uniref:hypothetical protein n=1 Tax=uncultured Dubosiella sp. TaxID=1937011 RepID=UPI00272AB1EC